MAKAVLERLPAAPVQGHRVWLDLPTSTPMKASTGSWSLIAHNLTAGMSCDPEPGIHGAAGFPQ
ncbi:hypothetical protein [Arthrobacter sp. WCS2018Hpa-5a]|uniref:hypothetical protein n=1 Tax=Arthrobacter sp. WCS2018Hpa-5a TaxID=3073630 RepID=UPI002882DA4B|nr:hypothetical protein [Arthrobacter sp. WCS2018Hpa-5a]